MNDLYQQRKPLAIDLFAGLGGWAEGFLVEGYDVIGFDIERHVYGDHRLSRIAGYSGRADPSWFAVQNRSTDRRITTMSGLFVSCDAVVARKGIATSRQYAFRGMLSHPARSLRGGRSSYSADC